MKNTIRSQTGGTSALIGFDYQKKFVAYLALGLLKKDPYIRRITCEHLDDIEVEQNTKIVYYQIKSTTGHTLPMAKIIESIKLFASIEALNDKKNSEYVLVSNADIRNIRLDDMIKHPYMELDDEIKNVICALEEIRAGNSFLERVFFLKGPALREIFDILTSQYAKALENRNFGFGVIENIVTDLLDRIGSMCRGPIDLADVEIGHSQEIEQRNLEYKSINAEILDKIIENNKPSSTGVNRRQTVTTKMVFKYNIMPTHLNDEKKKTIDELLEEYDDLQGDDFKITYLQKFTDFSKRFDLWKYNRFLDFLEGQIKNGTDKHIVLECLFTLHRLILTSKVEHDGSFLEYVNKHYFTFLKEKSESGIQTYEYSLFKIEQILEEIKDFIPREEMCEMYWNRMVKIIHEKDFTTNRLANCISTFNDKKCSLKPEWRKWLIADDEYTEIKNDVLKEISDKGIL